MLQAEDKRKISVCESVASTISVDHPSEDDDSSDNDDIIEDNDVSDTDSAPSPRPPSAHQTTDPLATGAQANNRPGEIIGGSTGGGSRAGTPVIDRGKRVGAEIVGETGSSQAVPSIIPTPAAGDPAAQVRVISTNYNACIMLS